MNESVFKHVRKSHTEVNNVYFFTATIHNWNRLLLNHEYKKIIIGSLNYLSEKQIIKVYGFVIMPNHIHIVWRINSMNGKETAQGSFLKFTAHSFRKKILQTNPSLLKQFEVDAPNKKHEFWQRDSLSFLLLKRDTAIQKLTYIHNNPIAKHWSLSNTPEDYYYPSAKFYFDNTKYFNFLNHLLDDF